MGEGAGFDVRPDVLRAVAAGLRDDACSVLLATAAVNEAVTPVHGAGGALATAVSELSEAIDRAAGAAQRDLESIGRSLEATSVAYLADDQRGATSFGALLSRRIPP